MSHYFRMFWQTRKTAWIVLLSSDKRHTSAPGMSWCMWSGGGVDKKEQNKKVVIYVETQTLTIVWDTMIIDWNNSTHLRVFISSAHMLYSWSISISARRLFIWSCSLYADCIHYGRDTLDLKTTNRGLCFLLITEFEEFPCNKMWHVLGPMNTPREMFCVCSKRISWKKLHSKH